MIRRHKIIYLVFIFLALQLIIISHAKAEYRVYRLGVTYEPGQPEVVVLTSLDDQQYETYNKITVNQTTRIIDHWMCWGRTNDFQEYCDKPLHSSHLDQNQAESQGDIPVSSKN